jgi:hypothetical protein
MFPCQRVGLDFVHTAPFRFSNNVVGDVGVLGLGAEQPHGVSVQREVCRQPVSREIRVVARFQPKMRAGT